MSSRISSLTTPTVFVVDNDPILRESLAWLLEPAGFAVQTFDSGEAFLDACSPEAAGCAVLDVRLPGISGVALQEELGRRGVRLPVIIVTGFADVPMAVRVLKAGALDVLRSRSRTGDPRSDRPGHGARRRAAPASQRARAHGHAARPSPPASGRVHLVVHGKRTRWCLRIGISEKTVRPSRARHAEARARSLADLGASACSPSRRAPDSVAQPWIARGLAVRRRPREAAA